MKTEIRNATIKVRITNQAKKYKIRSTEEALKRKIRLLEFSFLVTVVKMTSH